MKSLFDRLNYIWDLLLRSDLVQNPNATNASIDEFAKILNKSTPITPMEKNVQETVRHISTLNKNSFLAFLRNNDAKGMFLLCDGGSIASELGINERVDIRWNNAEKEYNVIRTGGTEGDKTRWADSKPRGTEGDKTRWADSKPRGKDKYNKNKPNPNSKKIPPISSKEQYQLMQKLNKTKTFVDAAGNSSDNTDKSPSVGVQLDNGALENIKIAKEDLIAISEFVGEL